MTIWIVWVTVFFAGQFFSYAAFTPRRNPQPISPSRIDRIKARTLFALAYALSLLRLPFAVLPYCVKLIGALVFNKHYRVSSHNLIVEALRIVGDILNWVLLIVIVEHVDFLPPTLRFAIYGSIYAEGLRLFTEKGQMLFSALWQFLPHRAIANYLMHRNSQGNSTWLYRVVARYCAYYALNDEQRIAYILNVLRCYAAHDPDAKQKLDYLTTLRIVPTSWGLRGGHVRDVARGEVFIHRRWTSDPWLLIGQALRRTPWMFDPRYLPRPFYYRSQSNRLATLFVLAHARYCPTYALYQFGHEVKSARYDLFYRVLRWLGVNIEPIVQTDGTFQFDQGIAWLKSKLNGEQTTQQDVVSNIDYRARCGDKFTALDIAVQHTYPLKYVEEVLKPYTLLPADNLLNKKPHFARGSSISHLK